MTQYQRIKSAFNILVVSLLFCLLSACEMLTLKKHSQPCTCPAQEQSAAQPESEPTDADRQAAEEKQPNRHKSEKPAVKKAKPSVPASTKTSANKSGNQSGHAKKNQSARAVPIKPGQMPADKAMPEKPVIGRVEYVHLEPSNLRLKARIDTGAGLSSLNALDLTPFERDGKPWIRFSVNTQGKKSAVTIESPIKRYIEIKQLGGTRQNRPVIELTVTLGPIKERIDVTLVDRSGYVYQVLIGRNFLRDRAIVDVSRKFSVKPI